MPVPPRPHPYPYPYPYPYPTPDSQLSIPEYRTFIDFMCDGPARGAADPPDGADPAQCPRPIFGTYDDHDSGGAGPGRGGGGGFGAGLGWEGGC
jgi:hypothetical protein